MSIEKKSLLQKFGIPINYLDFKYIQECKNVKDLEKIYRILLSGEEGYYPDLTKCAEEHLRALNPQSKWLRTEKHIDKENLKELNESFTDWSNKMKVKDQFLTTLSKSKNDAENSDDSNMSSIRGINLKIDLDEKIENCYTKSLQKTDKKNSSQVKLMDYEKWDKYDPDTEILKMDLNEERIREENERIKNLKAKESKSYVNTLQNNSPFNDVVSKLTNVEKEALATRYRESGNDYYRSGEYENAVKEYTKNITLLSSAVGYNNRAMAYLKLKNYGNCLNDCNECLKIDPKNIKALLRKGQALMELNKKPEAHETYSKILSIDPSNTIAQKFISTLKSSNSDSPPPNATRIKIIEEKSSSSKKIFTTGKQVQNFGLEGFNKKTEKTTIKPGTKMDQKKFENNEDDLSKLIIPNRIIKSKLTKAFEKIETSRKNDKNLSSTQNLKNNSKGTIKQNQDDTTLDLGLTNLNKKNVQKNSNLINEIK